MADFRRLAIGALLADGILDDAEVKVIKKELFADGKIDRKEVEFLIELRTEAQKRAKGQPLSKSFETMFFKAMEENVLDNGIISAREAGWLRKTLFADGKVDDSEKAFLKKLKKSATKTASQFDKLCEEVLGA